MSGHDSQSRYCSCSGCTGAATTGLIAEMHVVESALCDKLRSTRRLREITGLPLPRIRRALRELERQGRAREGTLHYNTSGRGALAHAPGWRKAVPHA